MPFLKKLFFSPWTTYISEILDYPNYSKQNLSCSNALSRNMLFFRHPFIHYLIL